MAILWGDHQYANFAVFHVTFAAHPGLEMATTGSITYFAPSVYSRMEFI